MGRGKLTRRNEWMFKVVKCSCYLRKIKDGRFIIHYTKDMTQDGEEKWCYAWLENGKNQEREIPGEDSGGSDFIKTYYERAAKEFAGVVVGFEMVTTKAMLYLDHNDCTDNDYVDKHPTEQVKCARVYYGCYRSWLVPLDGLVVLQEEKKGDEDYL
ncbi:MAG: hypothetical protein IJU50_04695 [Lachnospiraceae bacterium]|nr:hypothetical protein [Lachnospiraceae bacterium]